MRQYFYYTGGVIIIYCRIKELREEAGLSQAQIAKNLHMHRTTYVRYENGEREIPLNIAILLAKYYNVSLDFITGLTQKNVGEQTNI